MRWHSPRNSSLGGLRPSTLPLGHGCYPQYWIFTSEQGRYIFFFLKPEGQSGVRDRNIRIFNEAALNHCTMTPASLLRRFSLSCSAYIVLENKIIPKSFGSKTHIFEPSLLGMIFSLRKCKGGWIQKEMYNTKITLEKKIIIKKDKRI